MTITLEPAGVRELPTPPENPLPFWEKARAIRSFAAGFEELRDAGGPVSRLSMGPKWLFPPVVVVTSPSGGRDMLGRTDSFTEKKTSFHQELRNLFGDHLFSLPRDQWLPRRRSLQPVFTKQHVREFGCHMTQSARTACDRWGDDAEIDLDVQCRLMALRAVGRSLFGIDLDAHSAAIAEALQTAFTYVTARALRPVRAPRWLPTPARRRAYRAIRRLHDLAHETLTLSRREPDNAAPLVRALMDARDPDTGNPLSDIDICHELILFMLAGHDTTSTALSYALWQLGLNKQVQDRMRTEVHALGHADPTSEDVPLLPYTGQVLQESLRLCPPASAIGRLAVHDVEIEGYRVEAGTIVAFGVWAVQRDPALWRDPETFDPDRFSPEKAKQIDRWQYLPFGAGPRSCIGDHFAMLQATLALATIIGRCEITSLRDDYPVAVRISTVPSEPVPARVRALPTTSASCS